MDFEKEKKIKFIWTHTRIQVFKAVLIRRNTGYRMRGKTSSYPFVMVSSSCQHSYSERVYTE